MEEKQQLKEYQSCQMVDQMKTALPIKSQFYQQYLNCVAKIEQNITSNAALVFERDSIWYDQDAQYQQFSFQTVPLSDNQQIVNLKVFIGRFSLQIMVLNISSECPFTKEQFHQKGGYGTIFFCEFLNQQMAVKCLPIRSEQYHQLHLNKAIKELALMKIGSSLSVCPLMKRYLAFDLIVFEDYAAFAMEKCDPPQSIQEIDYALSLLHCFNIVHVDVKPQNIVYSPHFKKAVLIDFGFSEAIEESIGYKTCSTFKGTLNYCGGEMLDLFVESRKQGWVDLYYNDFISWKKTTEEYESSKRLVSNVITAKQSCLTSLYSLSNQFYLIFFKASIIYEDRVLFRYLLHLQLDYLANRKSRDIIAFLESLSPIKQPTELFQTEGKLFEKIRGFTQMQEKKKQRHVLQFFKINTSLTSNQLNPPRFSQMPNKTTKRPNLANKRNTQKDNLRPIDEQEAWLYSKELFLVNKEQHFVTLLENLRFDRVNLSFDAKNRIADTFLRNCAIQYSTSEDPMARLAQTFRYLADQCIAPPRSPWKSVIIFPVIYQLILTNIDVQPYVKLLVQKDPQHRPKWEQKALLWVWLQKYLQIILLKFKDTSNESDLAVAELCEERICTINEEIITGLRYSERLQERSFSKALIMLNELKSSQQPISKWDIQHFHQLSKAVRNQQVRTFLQYTAYDLLALNTSINKLARSFARVYSKIVDLLLKEKLNASNNYFHCLIDGYFKYQTIMRKEEGGSILREIRSIINCEEIFSMLKIYYYARFYDGQTGVKNYLTFLQKIQSKIFNCPLSRFLLRQFIFIMELAIDYNRQKLFSLDDYNKTCSILSEIMRKYTHWRQACHKRSINRIDILQSLINFICIQGQMRLAALNEPIRAIVRQIIDNLEVQLGYPSFTREEALAYASSKEPHQLNLYFQLLLYRAFQVITHNISASIQFYQLILLISQHKHWIFFMYLSLNNVIHQKLINKEAVDAELEKMIETCIKNESFLYYLQPSVNLILYTLQNYTKSANTLKMRAFLNHISQEISNNPIYRHIDAFIVNIRHFYNRNPQYKSFKKTNDIVKDLQWKNRYLIIMYVFIVGKQKDSEHNLKKIVQQIVKFIDQLNRMVKWAILPSLYSTVKNLSITKQRKKKWIIIRKEFNSYDKEKGLSQFINHTIFLKEKTSSRFYMYKKLLNRNLNKIIEHFI